MESLKALKSFQIRSLNVLTFSLMIGALSVHASDIYVVLGTDASKVYLRTGEVRLEYRYNMESVDSGHSNGYTDVNVEVADQQGRNLVRETNNTNFGSGLGKIFHSKFYNPIDQWVTIRGWGGEAVTARGGGGSFFIVAGRS